MAAPGDRAFAQQAIAWADALFGLARSLCKNDSEAEDLVQETLTRALRGEHGFVAGGNLKAWLFRILRNAFLDSRRRLHVVREEPDEGLEAAAAIPVDDSLLRGDRELTLLRNVVAADLEAALGKLPEQARTTVLLDAQGFTEGEIAEVLACAPGTVKSRLARARAALRVTLAEYRR